MVEGLRVGRQRLRRPYPSQPTVGQGRQRSSPWPGDRGFESLSLQERELDHRRRDRPALSVSPPTRLSISGKWASSSSWIHPSSVDATKPLPTMSGRTLWVVPGNSADLDLLKLDRPLAFTSKMAASAPFIGSMTGSPTRLPPMPRATFCSRWRKSSTSKTRPKALERRFRRSREAQLTDHLAASLAAHENFTGLIARQNRPILAGICAATTLFHGAPKLAAEALLE
jgi:hypothetical protein